MPDIIPASDPQALDLAVQALHAGELVAFPTDTVYGLGAAVTNDSAVRKMFAAKGRSPSKAVPILVGDAHMATWVCDVPPNAQPLIGAFWPGALTIVMKKTERFHSLAIAKEQTVAVRVPNDSFVRSMIFGLGEPVTGTSANRAGGRSPMTAQEAAMSLGDLVTFVIDGGPVRSRVESTIVDLTAEGGPKVLREGAISREELQKVMGKALG
jgi:L-threonylcarbamoyladenylate synthase